MAKFFRIPTEEEKQDFTDIGPHRKRGVKFRFQVDLAAQRLKSNKDKIPFFKKAAMDDFKEYYEEEAKKSLRKNGYVDPHDIKPLKMDWLHVVF